MLLPPRTDAYVHYEGGFATHGSLPICHCEGGKAARGNLMPRHLSLRDLRQQVVAISCKTWH